LSRDHIDWQMEGYMKRSIYAGTLLLALASSLVLADEYLGNYSANPNHVDSTSNPYGAGNPYWVNSINNANGPYGSPHSAKSVSNPYTTAAPKLYDSQGNYRGRLSSNPYDPDSVSNPYGRYGSPYSADSINNPYGAGSRYRNDSPNNPHGVGMEIYGE